MDDALSFSQNKGCKIPAIFKAGKFLCELKGIDGNTQEIRGNIWESMGINWLSVKHHVVH